ncbi:MAG: cell division protein FtsQ, partial [Bacteroidota bacterium]
EGGALLPLSDQHTARVLLIEAENWSKGSKNLREHADGAALLTLLNYIDQDPLWRAQIAYLHVNEKGKVTMTTQVSKQRIEFGRPEVIDKKFAKLRLFYKQVIPYKGWNTYKRVNLEFDNQIVCE